MAGSRAAKVYNEITGTDASEILAGTEEFDLIRGLGGNDQITGGLGNDQIVAGDGDDRLDGGEGRDKIYGGAGDDTLRGDAGRDRLVGGAGDDFFIDLSGGTYFSGGDGIDTVSYEGAKGRVYVFLDSHASFPRGGKKADRLYSIENVTGTSFADRIDGSHEGNFIRGGLGDDEIFGYVGEDRLYGAGGDDLIRGGENRDKLYGGDGDDILDGGGGGDRIAGGAGSDTASYYYARKGVTVSLADRTSNTGEAKNDRYISIENLEGSFGADVLEGDAGANVLNGRIGRDTLIGGGGSDRFIAHSNDHIVDFSRPEGDVIDVSHTDADRTTGKKDKFNFIGKDPFSGVAGELRYEHKGGDTFIYGNADKDDAVELTVKIDGIVDLKASDFIL